MSGRWTIVGYEMGDDLGDAVLMALCREHDSVGGLKARYDELFMSIAERDALMSLDMDEGDWDGHRFLGVPLIAYGDRDSLVLCAEASLERGRRVLSLGRYW